MLFPARCHKRTQVTAHKTAKGDNSLGCKREQREWCYLHKVSAIHGLRSVPSSKRRPLSLRGDARAVAPGPVPLEVDNRGVSGDPVVPQDHRVRPPPHTRLEVGPLRDMRIQQVQNRLALLNLEPHDPARELAVDVEGLVAGDGVPADERVDVLDRLALDDAAAAAGAGEVGLLDARVDGRECLEVGAEGGGELVVRAALVGEAGVPARGGRVVQEEGGQARRLELVRNLSRESDRISIGSGSDGN